MENNPITYALPILAVMMILEAAISAWRAKPVYDLKDFGGSMSQLGGNIVVKLLIEGSILAFNFWLYQHRIFDIEHTIGVIILLVILSDFIFYWFHRISHRVRFFWAIHVTHHSSQRMNLGTALRQPWFGPLPRVLFYWPLPLIGFDPAISALIGVGLTLYGFWTHTELVGRLGPFEWLFVSPAHHRAHHGSNPIYIDKNYANFLIIWDRLFGTFQDETEKVRYGIINNIDTYNPFRIAFHEWVDLARDLKNAASVKEAARFIWKPPGWHKAK